MTSPLDDEPTLREQLFDERGDHLARLMRMAIEHDKLAQEHAELKAEHEKLVKKYGYLNAQFDALKKQLGEVTKKPEFGKKAKAVVNNVVHRVHGRVIKFNKKVDGVDNKGDGLEEGSGQQDSEA